MHKLFFFIFNNTLLSLSGFPLLFCILFFLHIPFTYSGTSDTNLIVKDTISLNVKLDKAISYEIYKQVTEEKARLIQTIGVTAALFSLLFAFIGVYFFKSVKSQLSKQIESQIKNKLEMELKKVILDFETRLEVSELDVLYLLPFEEFREKNANIDRFKKDFKIIEEKKDIDIIKKYLDRLIRIYFDIGKDNEIASIINYYKDRYELLETSWANYAISNMSLYSNSGASGYKNHSLFGCEKSLEVYADYGIPRAIKIIIYVIDYKNLRYNNDEDFKRDVENVLNEIINIKGNRTAFEVYNYLENLKYELSDTLDILNRFFRDKMEIIKEKHSGI
jgi:hypothetical protein